MFTNLLLADEINRAPAKVQSALLEVMQERQVTIGRETHQVPDPFLVLATQNPIETEGTYALPEAQVDRFMLKVLVDYPSDREELVIVERMSRGLDQVREIIHVDRPPGDAEAGRRRLRRPAAHGVRRPDSWVRRGVRPTSGPVTSSSTSPSAPVPAPRSTLCWRARSLAMLRGRDYAVPADIADLAGDVMRHRIVLSYEALADNVSPDAVIKRIMEVVARPARPLTDEGRLRAQSQTASDGAGMTWKTA